VARFCDATVCRRIKKQRVRVIDLKDISARLRSVRNGICGILPVVCHVIREQAAELKDRSMPFSMKEAQLRPFKTDLDRLRNGNLSRERVVVVDVQRITARSYARGYTEVILRAGSELRSYYRPSPSHLFITNT
jgi:hypothetical protein